MYKPNNLILKSTSSFIIFILLGFAIYLLLAGHNSPGGGFIGGLVLASAIILLCLAFDIETVTKSIPLDFKLVAASGALIAVLTGLGSFIFDVPFLSQTFAYFDIPGLGRTELSTVTIFEAGVALTVVGVVVTIILSISEDV